MAVALTYNGGTYAVMMATPERLEDFALAGFSLKEGIVGAADEIRLLDILESKIGVELRLWLSDEKRSGVRPEDVAWQVPPIAVCAASNRWLKQKRPPPN